MERSRPSWRQSPPPRTTDYARRPAQTHPASTRPASTAIDGGARLSAIADAEREGEQRARRELSGDVLRQVTRAAERQRDADSEYEHAISRAGPARTLTPRDRRRRVGFARHQVLAVRQPFSQVIAIGPGPGEIDDAAAPAGSLQVDRDPRRRASPSAVAIDHHRHMPA
jgi:hypothetical protein